MLLFQPSKSKQSTTIGLLDESSFVFVEESFNIEEGCKVVKVLSTEKKYINIMSKFLIKKPIMIGSKRKKTSKLKKKKNKLTYGLGFGLIAIGAGAFRNP